MLTQEQAYPNGTRHPALDITHHGDITVEMSEAPRWGGTLPTKVSRDGDTLSWHGKLRMDSCTIHCETEDGTGFYFGHCHITHIRVGSKEIWRNQ